MELLRRLSAADAEELTALRVRNRAYLERWEPDSDDPDRWYRADGVAAWITDGHERFAIVEDGAIVGMTSLTGVQYGAFRSAMVSYFVDEARAGRGLATGAVGQLLEHAFGELDLHRVEAGTAVENTASQRVLEHTGFVCVGLMRKHLLIGGRWVDHYLWERIVGD